ncbi:MAG: RNA polymerase sigma factor [Gemmataceae bacterium]
MSSTPASLLERLRRPDPDEAWRRFVDLYTPLLYYWTRRAGLQSADAADLVQEVFALLLSKLPEFAYDSQRSFRSWLRTITLNKWHELHRCRQPTHKGERRLADVTIPNEMAELDDADYRHHLARRALRLMQAEFSEPVWRSCWQTVVEGRPAAEVAQQLGISVDAVYAAKSRVLRRLRHELQGLLE